MNMWSNADILAVTKSAIAQGVARGYMNIETGNLTALDDHFIVDLGQKLQLTEETAEISVGCPADLFFRSLISQMAKIVVDSRSYVAKLPSLYVSVAEWGLMSEFIQIDLSDVMIDEMWNPDGFIGWNETRTLSGGGTRTGVEEGGRIAAIEFGCYKPPVNTKLYKKVHAIMVALTTAREQFFTAFRNADEYARFLSGLFVSVENTIQVKAEVYGKMCVSMGIAKSFAGSNAIDLRTEFAAAGGTVTGVTREQLLNNAQFQAFALRRISEIEDEMSRYTALFNNHEHVTFAAEPKKILLSKFSSACKFGVRANTYNEQLLGIGDYDTITDWQAARSSANTSPYNLADASTISLTSAAADAAGVTHTTGQPWTQSGIIAVIYDRYAMGVTVDRKDVSSQWSASRMTMNHFYHAAINYIVNDNYPIVSFYVSDATAGRSSKSA